MHAPDISKIVFTARKRGWYAVVAAGYPPLVRGGEGMQVGDTEPLTAVEVDEGFKGQWQGRSIHD